MLPQFKRSGSGYSIGGLKLGLNYLCDCGQWATILATFEVNRPHGGHATNQDRDPLGSLFLCADCAAQLWEMDKSALCHNNQHATLTHFMGLVDAIALARSEFCLIESKKHRGLSQKWQEIIEYMREIGRPVVVGEIARKFNKNYNAIHQRMYQLTQEGVLLCIVERGATYYKVK